MWFSNARLRRATARGLACALLALLGACGGGGSGGVATVTTDPPTLNTLPPAPAVQNKLAIVVNAGPANTGYNFNRLYASVTVCFPGSTTQCQTIDHVLVDTGSTGLRLLASALAPGLNLNRTSSSSSGLPLLGCMQFIDQSFAWGPIATADITLGGKTAASTPVHIIGDPVFSPLAGSCSSGSPLQTAQNLGANGILGLNMQREDCGVACATHAANGVYFTCSNSTCSATIGTRATLAQQVAHPVPKFSTDNNGLLIDLPAVSTASAATLNGSLIFGIGTQTNNTPAPDTPVLTSLGGSTGISTSFAGRIFQTTYLDTGSNGYFFDSAGDLAACGTGINGFYCPAATTALTATLTGANGQTLPVSFSVANAAVLFESTQAVLPQLAGDLPDLSAFDFGLPFFYGRRVYFGIQDVSGDGAFVAFEASKY